MGLNIKNDRVHAMAREAARVTGLSQTGAIEAALERLLAEYGADPAAAEKQRRLEVLRSISRAWSPGTADEVAEVEELYDPTTGLPA